LKTAIVAVIETLSWRPEKLGPESWSLVRTGEIEFRWNLRAKLPESTLEELQHFPYPLPNTKK
jgi:hypothetical protein